VAQEGYFIDPELTLGKLGIKLVVSQSLKCDSKRLFIFLHTLQIYKDVVNEHRDKLVYLRHK
jgi:hypothetical protein